MITLSNGHSFNYVCASGALGFHGKGYIWERPLYWTKLIDPTQFTVITKTLTLLETVGNLKWWCPWRCVRINRKDTTINSVGLTNKGLYWWIDNVYPNIPSDIDIIVSITSHELKDTQIITSLLSDLNIKGIEFNSSCPNFSAIDNVLSHLQILAESKHPVILKIGYGGPYVKLINSVSNYIEAVDAINTIPVGDLNMRSPLEKYNLSGGISGPLISIPARAVLSNLKKNTDIPVISGGGIFDYSEARYRFAKGADAISFGTVFLHHPLRVKKIIKDLNYE